MKQHILGFSIALISLIGAINSPAYAGEGQNAIGSVISASNGLGAFGADAKIEVIDNVSIRPYIYLAGPAVNYGSGLTYEFKDENSKKMTPFIGVSADVNNNVLQGGLVAGADFDVTPISKLKLQLTIPLSTSPDRHPAIAISTGLRF
jgi:hypothetical protein